MRTRQSSQPELVRSACRDGKVDPRGLALHSDTGKPTRASPMIITCLRHSYFTATPRSASSRKPIISSSEDLFFASNLPPRGQTLNVLLQNQGARPGTQITSIRRELPSIS